MAHGAVMHKHHFSHVGKSSMTNQGRDTVGSRRALRDVKISYVHAAPDWIRQRGQVIGLARSGDRTLAFSTLRWVDRSCVVTLPYPWSVGETLYRRLRFHEERHCHGEEHHAEHFQDEEPFE
jgi:hypothetical protein